MQSFEEKSTVVTEEALGEEKKEKPTSRSFLRNQRQTLTIVLVLILWTYLFNVFIREQGLVTAFFHILNTISDDFVMGSLMTISVGFMIVALFSITKLYGQIVANIHSFKIIEDLWYGDLRQGRVKVFFQKLLTFKEQPLPHRVCPEHTASILFSFTFIYVMSCVYVILFSEALFFLSWSAGVDLPINERNVLFMPTLALAIPFSARVMAYVRYPYAQDYADFMPAAMFVLLMVTSLGIIFESDKQEFYLLRVFLDPNLRLAFLTNGIFLAFIPVFFEAIYWLIELHRLGEKSTEPENELANVSSEIDRTAE